MEVLELIKNRWSPRSLKNDRISDEQIEVILKAASFAFSANNLQPWQYTYAHNGTEGFQRILSVLNPFNQVWAQNASVLIITSAKRAVDGVENSSAVLDLGSANMNLALQAFSMNIYSHFMAGFDKSVAHEVTGLGEDYICMAVVALGALDTPENLPSPYREREVGPKERNKVEFFSKKI